MRNLQPKRVPTINRYSDYLIRMKGLEGYAKKDLLVGLPPSRDSAVALNKDAFVKALRGGLTR